MTTRWGHPVGYVVCVLAGFGVSHLLDRSPSPPILPPTMAADGREWEQLQRIADLLERESLVPSVAVPAAAVHAVGRDDATLRPVAEPAKRMEVTGSDAFDQSLLRAVLVELRGIRESMERSGNSGVADEMPTATNEAAVHAAFSEYEQDADRLTADVLQRSASATLRQFGRPSKMKHHGAGNAFTWIYDLPARGSLHLTVVDGIVTRVRGTRAQ